MERLQYTFVTKNYDPTFIFVSTMSNVNVKNNQGKKILTEKNPDEKGSVHIQPPGSSYVLRKRPDITHVIVGTFPPTGLDEKGFSIGIPMGLLHSVAFLDEAGYKLQLIDQRIDKKWRETLQDTLKKNKVKYFLVSTMTGAQLKGAMESSKMVRAFNPLIKIIWGGVHPSLLPEQTLQESFVDYVIINEGEETLFELISKLDSAEDIHDVKGIGFKNCSGTIIINSERAFINLNLTKSPPYHLLPDLKNYYLNLYNSIQTLSLNTGRGCPFRCGFCYNTTYNKQSWRALEPKEMIRRIKELQEYGAKSVDLVDDMFFTSSSRVHEFIELLEKEKLGMNFLCNVRAHYIANMDQEFLNRMADVGFKEMFIGVETGSNEIMKLIKKDMTVENVIQANLKLNKTGIRPLFSFVGGFPAGEHMDDVIKTVDLMVRLITDNSTASLTSLKIYTPFPGSELFELAVKEGFVPPKNIIEWSTFNYNTQKYEWSNQNDRKLLKKLSYLTYFLDQHSMSNITKNKILKFFIKLYSKLIYFRCKYHFFAFTPEVEILDRVYRTKFAD